MLKIVKKKIMTKTVNILGSGDGMKPKEYKLLTAKYEHALCNIRKTIILIFLTT